MNSTNSLLLLASQRAYLLFFLIFCCMYSYGYTYCQDFGTACDDGSLATTGDIYNESCECIGAGFCGNGIVIDDVVTYTCSIEGQSPACETWDATRINNGLIAHYTFDDGTSVDVSGNGHHGIEKNNVQYTPGIQEQGLLLDNRSSYIEVADHDDLVIQDGESITIGARFLSSPGDVGDIISKPWNSSGNYHYRIVQTASDNIYFTVNGSSNGTIISKNAPIRGGRHHVMMVITPTTMSAYIDGHLIEEKAHGIANWTPASPGDQNRSLAIGTLFPYGNGGRNIPQFTIDGQIDDVRIYDRGLSAIEISAIYHSAKDILCVTNEDDLLGRYTFDISNTDDVSGNAEHGTSFGGVTYVDDPERGIVTAYDGIDDYIRITNQDLVPGMKSMTYAAWVKSDQNTNKRIVSMRQDAVGPGPINRKSTELYAINNRYHFDLTDGISSVQTVGGPSVASDNERHFVVGVIDRINQLNLLYIDGVLEDSRSIAGLGPIDPIGDMYIGIFNKLYAPWVGELDDISFYERALSIEEIQHMYHETVDGTEICVDSLQSGLVAHYAFDGDTTDDTGFQHDGTMQGGATFENDIDRGDVIDFDGIDSNFECGEVPLSYNHHTVSGWFNFDDVSGYNTIIKFPNTDIGRGSSDYRLYNDVSGRLSFRFHGSQDARLAPFNSIFNASNPLSPNQRYHIVATYDGDKQIYTLYVDDEVYAVYSGVTHPAGRRVGCRIGYSSNNPGNDYYFDGRMDDVRVYNRTLSSHEVSELHKYTRSEPQPRLWKRSDDLLAHYSFDDMTVDDQSGFDHHGLSQNGVTFVNDAIRGQVMSLDGVDDFVSTEIPKLRSTQEFSVGGWIYSDGTQSANGASLFRVGPGTSNGFALEPITNHIRVNIGTNGFYSKLYSPLIHNKRQHVFFTYKEGTSLLYSDGELVDSTTVEKLELNNISRTWIGRRGGHLQDTFDGMIDDMRVYDRAITQDEIELLYLADGIEQCDDTNTKDNDRCSNACIAEYCRDDAPLNDTSKNFVITSLDPTSIAGTSSQPDSEVAICFEDINGNADVYYTTTDAGGSFSYVPSLASYPGPRVNVGIMLHDQNNLDIDHHSLIIKK